MEVERKDCDKHLGFILSSNGIDTAQHVANRASTFQATVTAVSFAAQALPNWTRAVMIRVNALPALEWGLGLIGHATYHVGRARQQVLDTMTASLQRATQVIFTGNAGHEMTKMAMVNIPTAARMLSEWEARLTYHLRHRVSVYNPVITMLQAALQAEGTHSALHTAKSRILPHAGTHPLYTEWLLYNQDKPLDDRLEMGEWFKATRNACWLSGGKSAPYLKTVLYLLPGQKKWGGIDSSLFVKDHTTRRHLILWRLGVPLELRCPTCNTNNKLDRGHFEDCHLVDRFMEGLDEAERTELREWKAQDQATMLSLVPDADLHRFSYLDVMLNHAPDTAERLIMSLTSREAEHHQQPP
jgi:hypothetical protein